MMLNNNLSLSMKSTRLTIRVKAAKTRSYYIWRPSSSGVNVGTESKP